MDRDSFRFRLRYSGTVVEAVQDQKLYPILFTAPDVLLTR